MKYVIYGAGAVGGTIGAQLLGAGREVVFVARGENLRVLRRNGLRFRTPEQDRLFPVDAFERPDEVEIGADDRVLLCVKGQDSDPVLRTLAETAHPDAKIICAQNGVYTDDQAYRYFENVFGVIVLTYAVHMAPGVVECHTAPHSTILDIGRWKRDLDDTTRTIAAELAEAGILSHAQPDIARWKYAKLVGNSANALYVLAPDPAEFKRRSDQVRAETEACLRAAGVDFAPLDEWWSRLDELGPVLPVGGRAYPGGSSWQSFQRGGAMETDFLNGEIVRLGRLHGFPTPYNAEVQRQVWAASRRHAH